MSDPRERSQELEALLDRVEAFESTLAATYAELDKYRRLLSKRLNILKAPAAEAAARASLSVKSGSAAGAAPAAKEPAEPARAVNSGVRKLNLGGGESSARSGTFRREQVMKQPPGSAPGTRQPPGSASGTQQPPAVDPNKTSGQFRRPQSTSSSKPGAETVIRKAPPELAALSAGNADIPAATSGSNPGTAAAPPAATNQRTAPRRAGNPVPVLLSVPGSGGEPLQGWVLDRSSGGLRILIDQAFKADALLNVRPTKAHSSFPWIEVEVRSCQPERGSYNVGCQFTRKLTWAELQMFG
jgi:hypothetical protein